MGTGVKAGDKMANAMRYLQRKIKVVTEQHNM
jgi:hypothetical protein